MGKYFTGTSTGNRYEVGRAYEMNGAAYVAQDNGTFQKQGNIVGRTDTGRVVVDNAGRGTLTQGSAGNPDVSWYASPGTRSAAGAGYSPGESIAQAASQRGGGSLAAAPANNAGAGVIPIANGSRGSSAVGRAVSAAGRGLLAAWSGIDDPPQHYMVAGHHMVASPRSSNMAMVEERQGDAEFLSPAWFASWGIAADDYVESLAVRAYGNEKTWDREHRAQVQKAFVEDVGGSIIGWGLDTITGIRTSAAANAASGRAAADRARDEREANNRRDELEAIEAQALELRRDQRGNVQNWWNVKYQGTN